MFEAGDIVAFGIPLLLMVFGLVEFFKDLFNMEGKKVTLLAISMGILLYVPVQLIGLIAAPYELILSIVYGSLAFGLSASGYYKFVAKRVPQIPSE
jgi:hypothetical protein